LPVASALRLKQPMWHQSVGIDWSFSALNLQLQLLTDSSMNHKYFTRGVRVRVVKTFQSNDESQTQLARGLEGTVDFIDGFGDASIGFDTQRTTGSKCNTSETPAFRHYRRNRSPQRVATKDRHKGSPQRLATNDHHKGSPQRIATKGSQRGSVLPGA
jgi:hypothetical protein